MVETPRRGVSTEFMIYSNTIGISFCAVNGDVLIFSTGTIRAMSSNKIVNT